MKFLMLNIAIILIALNTFLNSTFLISIIDSATRQRRGTRFGRACSERSAAAVIGLSRLFAGASMAE